MKNIILLMSLVFIVSCAGVRDLRLVSMRQDNDTGLACKELGVEYKSNTKVAEDKIAVNLRKDKKDFWYGLLAWFWLVDVTNADGVEANAFLDRNVRLIEIARNKGCHVKSWPTQPSRY